MGRPTGGSVQSNSPVGIPNPFLVSADFREASHSTVGFQTFLSFSFSFLNSVRSVQPVSLLVQYQIQPLITASERMDGMIDQQTNLRKNKMQDI